MKKFVIWPLVFVVTASCSTVGGPAEPAPDYTGMSEKQCFDLALKKVKEQSSASDTSLTGLDCAAANNKREMPCETDRHARLKEELTALTDPERKARNSDVYKACMREISG